MCSFVTTYSACHCQYRVSDKHPNPDAPASGAGCRTYRQSTQSIAEREREAPPKHSTQQRARDANQPRVARFKVPDKTGLACCYLEQIFYNNVYIFLSILTPPEIVMHTYSAAPVRDSSRRSCRWKWTCLRCWSRCKPPFPPPYRL